MNIIFIIVVTILMAVNVVLWIYSELFAAFVCNRLMVLRFVFFSRVYPEDLRHIPKLSSVSQAYQNPY